MNGFLAGTEVVGTALEGAIAAYERLFLPLAELASRYVMSSHPVETARHRYREAFIWSAREGHCVASGIPTMRRRYASFCGFPRATEILRPSPQVRFRVGVQHCGEIMLTQHADEIGFGGARLIAHSRAIRSPRSWTIASAMSAVASGCYVATANRRSFRSEMFSGGSWVLSPDVVTKCQITAETLFATTDINFVRSMSPLDGRPGYLARRAKGHTR